MPRTEASWERILKILSTEFSESRDDVLSIHSDYGADRIDANKMEEIVKLGSLSGYMNTTRSIAEEALAEKGLPTYRRRMMIVDGVEAPFDQQVFEEALQLGTNAKFWINLDCKKLEALSPEYFAAKILYWLEAYENNIEQEDCADVAFAAIQISEFRSRLLFARFFEQNSTRGASLVAAGRIGGKMNADKPEMSARRSDWQKQADELWLKNPGHSKMAVATIIAKKYRSADGKAFSRNTIRSEIKKSP